MQLMLPTHGEVRESHVDWLTATAADEHGRRTLQAHAPRWLADQHEAGNRLAPWSWQGYTGWHCGQVSMGDRDDTTLIRLSGLAAAARWVEVVPSCGNVSRIDLAVTVQLNSEAQEVATASYAHAMQRRHERGSELQCSLILNSDDGATCYLGSRSSDKFARIYDKARESGEAAYAGCWRYEIELKRKPALACARWLLAAPDTAIAVRQYVGRYLHDRGVSPPWPLNRRLQLPAPVPHRTDDQRRLAWLHDQVRPAVLDLLARYDRSTVDQALGLATPGGQ